MIKINEWVDKAKSERVKAIFSSNGIAMGRTTNVWEGFALPEAKAIGEVDIALHEEFITIIVRTMDGNAGFSLERIYYPTMDDKTLTRELKEAFSKFGIMIPGFCSGRSPKSLAIDWSSDLVLDRIMYVYQMKYKDLSIRTYMSNKWSVNGEIMVKVRRSKLYLQDYDETNVLLNASFRTYEEAADAIRSVLG